MKDLLLPYYSENLIEAGCDEAGRGPLAGPVYAAAVILPKDFNHPLLNDSKQLSQKQRYEARDIIEREAISFSVVNISEQEIDLLNILKASVFGMHKALDGLSVTPELILVDGNKFFPYRPSSSVNDPFFTPAYSAVSSKNRGYVASYDADNQGFISHKCIVKGDSKYTSIAAASILAKTYRDDYMVKIAREYPQYGWDVNMGYPTAAHREAIAKYGVTPYHRRSFQLLPQQELF